MKTASQISWVDLIEWDPLAKSGVIRVRVLLSGDHVSFQGELALVSELKNGLAAYPAGQLVLPEDGMVFLETMTKTFRNPTLLATKIQTGTPSSIAEPVVMEIQES